jgi:hypothetical protein
VSEARRIAIWVAAQTLIGKSHSVRSIANEFNRSPESIPHALREMTKLRAENERERERSDQALEMFKMRRAEHREKLREAGHRLAQELRR